jgi:hypothetical protein
MVGSANPAFTQQAQAPQNVFSQSAGALTNAIGGTQAAMAGPNIAQFQNPFTSQVVDRTQQDIERQRQMAMNTIGAQAEAAGAFGGSRQGVAEALTNEGFARQSGNILADLNRQGFNTALGAAQNQQQIGLQGAGQLGGLSNLGFDFGQQIGQQQAQQGALQQAMNQQLINAARGQFQGFTGAPEQALTLPMAAVAGASQGQQTQSTSQNPGLFNVLGLGANIGAGLLGLCWVAREVYGPSNPAWVEFREWLTTRGPRWLLRLYARHGEAFAGVVRRKPWLKRVLRPMMDAARRSMR